MLKITKTRLDPEEARFGCQCEMCGYPMDMDEDEPTVFEIQNMEDLAFCSRICAVDYLQNAEYDMSDSATEGGYAIF